MTLSPVDAGVDPRPRRIWFLVAAVVASGGVLAAAGVMLFLPRSGGDLGQPITPGQPVAVQLSLSDEKVVWAGETGQGFPTVECAAAPTGGQEISEYSQARLMERVEIEVAGKRWRGLLVVHAEPPGTYEVTCRTSGGNPAPELAIGDPPRFSGPRDTTLLTLAAIGGAGISVITGTLLAVVVAVRRGSHRARLRRQSAGSGGRDRGGRDPDDDHQG